ncbi:MAG TPA: phosphoribosylglycinamide formyltransferase [Gemmatimonadaceae bacterium]|jgi:formyltetrahydrofolate-dependent phosphoribosylglycinamide formyltransferase
MKRVAVLASGSGTNLQAILDHLASRGKAAAARVVLVASDWADARALTRASEAGVPTAVLDREGRTAGLLPLLARHEVDLIVLAGYLRLVPRNVTTAWRGRILNVHPALLPAFGGHGMYGMRVHESVLARGARVSGVTVHFVDERFDEGPIIAQWPVRVFPDDTPAQLAARVLEAEHALLPHVVEAVAAGAISLTDQGRVAFATSGSLMPHFAPAADLRAAVENVTVAWPASDLRP